MEKNNLRDSIQTHDSLLSKLVARQQSAGCFIVPEHTAHEQQMLWDLCWVEEGWAVRAQAGQESPGSPGAVFAGPAQPQAP